MLYRWTILLNGLELSDTTATGSSALTSLLLLLTIIVAFAAAIASNIDNGCLGGTLYPCLDPLWSYSPCPASCGPSSDASSVRLWL